MGNVRVGKVFRKTKNISLQFAWQHCSCIPGAGQDLTVLEEKDGPKLQESMFGPQIFLYKNDLGSDVQKKLKEVCAHLLSFWVSCRGISQVGSQIRYLVIHELVSNYLHSFDASNSSSAIIRGIYCWPFLLWKAIIIFLLQNRRKGLHC